MHAIFIFGFMLPIAGILISNPLIGVDWKTAFRTCSGDNSRLPRVMVKNNMLELEDHISSNISNTFWLGAVYEPVKSIPLNVSDNDLGFPGVCCGVFPALLDKSIDSCISCHDIHAFKCKIGERSDFEGMGPWTRASRLCLPSTMTRGDKDEKYWTYDIRQLRLDPPISGQENITCTYYCADSVLIGDCSKSSGVDAICVTDKVDSSHPSDASTVSIQVSTSAGNSSLKHTTETLSTHSVTRNETSTGHSTSIYTHMTGNNNHQRSQSHLTPTSLGFTNSMTKSNNDTEYATSSNTILPSTPELIMQRSSTSRRTSDDTSIPHVADVSQQLSTSTVITSQPQPITYSSASTKLSSSNTEKLQRNSNHQRSPSHLTPTSLGFTNSVTKSNNDTTYATSSNTILPSTPELMMQSSSTSRRMSDDTSIPHVADVSQQLSTSTVITSQPQPITHSSASTKSSSSNTEKLQNTSNTFVKIISAQLTTSAVTSPKPRMNTYTSESTKLLSSNTENTLTIAKNSITNDPYVITLIAVMGIVSIAFFVVLFLYCRLRRTRLKSLKSHSYMMDNVSFSASSRLNPIYGVGFAVNSDPHGPVGYLDPGYYTASDVSAFPKGESNRERRLPPGSEEWSELRESRNIATYACPMMVPRARIPSSTDGEQKRENENGGTESTIYAFPMKDRKFRKYTNDAEGMLDTPDHKNMDTYPVESNVSKARLSGRIDETSEGDYDRTDFSGWALDNRTSHNIYDTTNFSLSRSSVGIDTYL